MVTDYLGNELKIGDKVVRVNAYKSFEKAEIKNFSHIVKWAETNFAQHKNTVGILTEGNKKIGYTFPERLIKI